MYIPLWLLWGLCFYCVYLVFSDVFGGPSAKEIRRQAYAEIESHLAELSRYRLRFNEYDKSDLAKLKAFRGPAWDSTGCEDRSQAPLLPGERQLAEIRTWLSQHQEFLDDERDHDLFRWGKS